MRRNLPAIGLLQSILRNFVSWSTYMYALRVPLLACAFLVLFPILDLMSPGFAQASRGILSLENHSQLVFAGALAILTCWLAMILARVVLAYGNERFAIRTGEQCETPPPAELRVTGNMPWRTVFLWTLPSWALLARVIAMADFESWMITRILAVVVGFVFAFAVLYVTAWIHLHEKDPDTPLGHALVMPITATLRRAHAAPPFSRRSWFAWLLSRLGPGYTRNGRVHSGHSLASAFALVLLLLYLGGYRLLMPHGQGGATYFPVLCYVLILVMIGTSVGGALSFFVDRYRLPLFILIVVYSLLFNFVLNAIHFSSDHFYEVLRAAEPHRLTPRQVVEKWREHHAKDARPMAVVTATGGGIQAAAWTAKVLTGLQTELEQTACKKDPQEKNIFGSSIVLISSVSGGSVGSMYFAEDLAERAGSTPPMAGAFVQGCAPLPVAQAARASSLREAAWGLAYPDALRTAFPLLAEKPRDRGWAIEQAWKRCWPGAARTLNGWAEALDQGAMPAVILNATTAESGQRFLLTNYQPPESRPAPSGDTPELTPSLSFARVYPDYDLPVTTAARLSATFVYVTAMAKAGTPDQPRFHLADGGYYDNYGIVSAVEWLLQATLPDAAFPGHSPNAGRKLLLIQIEASPEQKPQSAATVEKQLPRKEWDWLNQLTAPLSTMMNVRTSGQAERNEVTLKMLDELKPGGFTFERKIFAFHDPNAPLSWHLTKAQQEAIDANWRKYQGKNIQDVKQAFGCK